MGWPSAEPETSPSAFRIPSLDGIRAVSILLVFVAHVGWYEPAGGLGVTVFFFLSGYLITTLLRREFEARGSIDVGSFYRRRAWRILPPMYAALALGTVASLTGLTPGQVTLPALALQAAHLTNYAQVLGFTDGIPAGTSVMWSLAIEEHFYLVFPAAALVLLRRGTARHRAMILLAVCALVLGWRFVLVEGLDASPLYTYLATDARLDAIIFGCVMGFFLNPMLDPPIRVSPAAASLIGLGCLTVLVVSLLPRNSDYRSIFRYTLQPAILAPLFYLAIRQPTLWLFRVFNVGWIAFVGTLSYSFYLVHHIVIFAFARHAPGLTLPARAALAGPASLAVAYLFHRLIERPAASRRHRRRVTTAPASV